MSGQMLTGGLVSLEGNDLRMVYALVFKVNIGNLLYAKAKDTISREDVQHFNEHLEAEVAKLEGVSDAELQVDLFLEMTKQLNLRGTNYTTEQEIIDQGTNIITGVYELMLKDKQFKAYATERPAEGKLFTIINYQLQLLFSEIDKNIANVSAQDINQLVEQVKAYIESLPEEKQVQIKEKLGIDDLTSSVLKQTIAVSGTSLIFAVIVEVSGFAFYTTATSLLATVTGAIGLTLPFGAYTFLTSIIAVLANPIFLLALLFGGGALYTSWQNKSLKKKFLPIIVLQMSLPYVTEGTVAPDYSAFISEWERRLTLYIKVKRQLISSNEKIAHIENKITETKRILQAKKAAENNAENKITAIKKDIYEKIKTAHLPTLEVSASFKAHSREYEQSIERINREKLQRDIKPVTTNVFDKLKRFAKDAKATLDIKLEERKAHQLLEMMVEDVLTATTAFESANRELVKTKRIFISELQREQAVTSQELTQLGANLTAEKSIAKRLLKQMKQIEKEHHGLADLNLSDAPHKQISESLKESHDGD